MHAYHRPVSRSRSQLRHRTKCTIITKEKPIYITPFFHSYVTLTCPPCAFSPIRLAATQETVSAPRAPYFLMTCERECRSLSTLHSLNFLSAYINLHSDRHSRNRCRATRVFLRHGTVSSSTVAAHFRSRNRTAGRRGTGVARRRVLVS